MHPFNRTLRPVGVCAFFFITMTLHAAGRPDEGKTSGWRGDGTGRYPDAEPPVTWERTVNARGEYEVKNILWTVPLPAASASSPIVVGDRVFVTSEISDLICLDKKTCRVLWIRSNTPYDAMEADLRKQLESELVLRYDSFRTNVLRLAATKPLDRRSAAQLASYRVTGFVPSRVELSADGRTVLFTAAQSFEAGAEITVAFPGLKSVDGMASKDPVSLKILPGIPGDGGLMQEFLVGGVRRGIDLKTVFTDDLAGAKTLRPADGVDRWTRAHAEDGRIDLKLALGDLTDSVACAHAYVYSDADRVVQLWIGSDDGVRVIVNGEPVFAWPGARSCLPDADKIPGVRLKKGWNTLLLDVSNGSGGWEACCRILDETGKAAPAGVSYQAQPPASPEAIEGRVPVPQGGSALLARLDPLTRDMAAANDEAIRVINASLSPAGPTREQRQTLAAVFRRKRDAEQAVYSVMALHDRKAYGLDWQQTIFGHSAATPVSDGKHVYVWMATGVVASYDMEGRRRWIRLENYGNIEHGTYASPALAGGRLITWMNGLTAYDEETGKIVWRERGRGSDFGSVVISRAGTNVLATCSEGSFVRVADGREIWPSLFSASQCTTPIVEGTALYSFKDRLVRLTLPETVDAPAPKPDWSADIKWGPAELTGTFARGYISSPLYHEGLIYLLAEGAGFGVLDAANGQEVYHTILDMKPRIAYWTLAGCSASPAFAGGRIYVMDNSGITIVIKPGREFKSLARNVIANLDVNGVQDVNVSSPAFDGRRIYIRGPEYLYCIGESGR